MLTFPSRLIAPLALSTLIAACAASPPTSASPPRLQLPAVATRPCRLPVLPLKPTESDLERVYVERGAALIACDGARRLAVEAARAQGALQRP